MNDRFRFRKPVFSKDKKFKKFVYFELFDMPAFTARSSDIIGKEEQCTGLKDKNGRLIYEGDIVKFKISSIKCVGAVRWDERTGGWLKDKTGQPLHTYIKSVEVIGNIHENPELLEWEK